VDERVAGVIVGLAVVGGCKVGLVLGKDGGASIYVGGTGGVKGFGDGEGAFFKGVEEGF
jgi:hypothetical protein